MRKVYLLLLALFMSFSLAQGKSISVVTAKTVGFNFLHQRLPSLSDKDLSLVYTAGDANPYFFVFSGQNCFVMVSAEDATVPVIGYSTENRFAEHLPSNAAAFFESYKGQIRSAQQNALTATPEVAQKWNDLLEGKSSSAAARTTTVAPLLSTTWDQYPYYNANCPADPGASWAGGHDVTGCVATATAQVMKFWHWPTTGTGIHSYATSSYGTLTADFGAHTYNWAAMPNSVSSANPAVAQLMSDVGIAVDMDYSPSESGAFVISATSPITNCAEYALKTYFSYKPTTHGEPRSSYADATWTGMLKADLDAGRPIIYDGAGAGGGHCFVLDGYDASGNFHINFGWSGMDNGYFSINAINPAGVGTGGGSGDYNSNQEAILGLEPISGGTSGGATTLSLYDYVTISPSSSINYIGAFTVSTNIQNTGSSDFNGDFCAAAFNSSTGAFITYIDSFTGVTLPSGYVFSSPLTFTCTGSVALVPGTYSVGVFSRPTGGSWVAVADASPYTNFTSLTVVNSNFIELYSAISTTPGPLVQGAAATVHYSVYNNSGTPWADSLYLGIYDLAGNYVCDIQALGTTTLGSYASSGTLTFSTSSVAATPGTYLLVPWFKYSGNWYLTGADYYSNPIYVTVVAPPPAPDIYEVNNSAATAYDLSSTLTWVSNVSSTSTPGANFHITTDQDYYKIVLAAGYNYTISAGLSDDVSPGAPYTVDAVWSYSADGGATWSSVFNNSMTGTIAVSNGGTVIFHVSPHFAGDIGTYQLNVTNITRTVISSVPEVNLQEARIYPNPAKDFLTVDLSNTGARASTAVLTDVRGKQVFSADAAGQSIISIPVSSVADGFYFLNITTDAGTLTRKITVGK